MTAPDQLVPPAFPRMTQDDAVRRVLELTQLPLSKVRGMATTSLENASYYQTATRRATLGDISALQAEIWRIADAHGFPDSKPRGGMVGFDRVLSARLFALMDIVPADAADEGVWSFVTLNLCPDVAFWRYPKESNPGIEAYERWIGKPRNIFRRAWWRGYLLGQELSDQLLEDEVVGLMERPSIGGHVPLARIVASTHLAEVAKKSVPSRQDLLRQVTKRLRRRLALISVYSLDANSMKSLVDEIFGESIIALGTSREDIGEVVEANPLEEFKNLLPQYWPLLEQYALEVPWVRMEELKDQLNAYRLVNQANIETATKISSDLNRLIADWADLTSNQRAVLHAATSYFLLADDDVPDGSPLGLDDDAQVVAAAYVALDRDQP